MDPILKNLIRVGIVSSINAARCTARVSFESQETVSYELPVIVRGSLAPKDYWMPAVGEQVLCLFLPNGNAQGFVLGSFYSNVDKPVIGDEAHRYIQFEDGTKIDYDKSSKTLTIIANGPINITANAELNITGNVNINGKITTTDDVIANGISLHQHVHGDVMDGPSKTGKPE